jgi:hypothetical protein
VLGQRHFFKPRADIKRDNILRRHLVVKNKDDRNKPFYNGRIAVALQSIVPSSLRITIHTWLWQP